MLSFFNFFKKKTTRAKALSFTTDRADTGFTSHEEMVSELIKDGKIDHDKLSALSTLYFGVKLENCLYKIKNSSIYGVLMQITTIHFEIDENKRLKDIHISFADVGMMSSLRVVLSVKDVLEFLEPVHFNENHKPRKEKA